MIKRIFVSLIISILVMVLLFKADYRANGQDHSYFYLSWALLVCTYTFWIGSLLLIILFFLMRYYNPFLTVFIPIFNLINIGVTCYIGQFEDVKAFLSNTFIRLDIITILIIVILALIQWANRSEKA